MSAQLGGWVIYEVIKKGEKINVLALKYGMKMRRMRKCNKL